MFLINRAILTEQGVVPPHSVGVALSRCLGAGVHQHLYLSNHGPQAILQPGDRHTQDFADIFEVEIHA